MQITHRQVDWRAWVATSLSLAIQLYSRDALFIRRTIERQVHTL